CGLTPTLRKGGICGTNSVISGERVGGDVNMQFFFYIENILFVHGEAEADLRKIYSPHE
ncbi:unnamed protein product, partial [Sphenostylis stenocarpa]